MQDTKGSIKPTFDRSEITRSTHEYRTADVVGEIGLQQDASTRTKLPCRVSARGKLCTITAVDD
jgi:hypothetical protein